VNAKELMQRYSAGERDFAGADLRGADLQGVTLRGADFSGADLREADLSGADLSQANLYGADLRGASLRGVNLRGSNMQGVSLGGPSPAARRDAWSVLGIAGDVAWSDFSLRDAQRFLALIVAASLPACVRHD